MPRVRLNTALFISLIWFNLYSQVETDSLQVITQTQEVVASDTIIRKPIDPLSPSKAAFYSAVLPGLGQAYNGRYWKVPIVWGALATGIIIYDFNDEQLDRYRDAYKRRLAGFTDDEFYGVDEDGEPLASPRITNDGLIRAQRQLRRTREISLLVTIGLYVLNIIDANVDAHLMQYNVDENLSLRPHYKLNDLNQGSDLGLTLNFSF